MKGSRLLISQNLRVARRLGVLAAIAGVVLALVAAAAPAAHAQEKRIALVIGNAAYEVAAWRLTNPINDARDVERRLREDLGFDTTLVINADRTDMEEALLDFGARLRAAGEEAVSFVYYAGHGAQHAGVNYLIPTDADARTSDQLRYQAPALSFLIDDMAVARNAVNIIILDACRDMPLPNSGRSLSRGGLARVESTANLVIGYATAPGATAADGGGRNSPYTRALKDALDDKARDALSLLLGDVGKAVRDATNDAQRPEFRYGLRDPRWALLPIGGGRDDDAAADDQDDPDERDAARYPLETLHPDVREAASDARRAARRAERAAERAYDSERGAEGAARLARAGETGHRRMVLPDGDQYEGAWSEGARNGLGLKNFVRDRYRGDRYAGRWRDGDYDGPGVFRFAENPNNAAGALRYAGDYDDGQRNGFGVFLWRDGHSYRGGERAGLMDGFGVMEFEDGRRYEGEWKNGEYHGLGVLWSRAGVVRRQGVWTNSRLTQALRP